MKIFFSALMPCFLWAGLLSVKGQDFQTQKDLRSEWTVFEDGKFIPFADKSSKTEVVYFVVNTKEHLGSLLRISDKEPFTVFINNNLAASGKSLLLNIDSLQKEYSSLSLTVAVHQRGVGQHITTEIVQARKTTDPFSLAKRSGSGFNDFAIAVLLLLLIFGIVIVRLNPKLALDYFSVSRILSPREFDEGQTYTRIGSSTNILFYIFSSMLLAYYLILIFHFVSDTYSIAELYTSETFLFIVMDWLKLAGTILALLFLKIILVYGVSYIFGFSEIAGLHFFNWVRLLLLLLGISVFAVFIYLIWHGQSHEVYSTSLKLLAWFNAVWMIIIFFKVSGKVTTSMFHLFSYICATELIPFLFIIKVLYK